MAKGKGKSIYGREYLEAPVTQDEVQPETEVNPLQDNSDLVAVPVEASVQPMVPYWMLIVLALIILLLLMGAYLVGN